MDTPHASSTQEHASHEKHTVALSSLLAATVLTLLKLVVGLATNSLGILSEAAHSALDLLAAGVTLWAVRMSARPADRLHTYGYGKFENLSALFETLLLLVTCIWIVFEAVERLFVRETVEVDPSIMAFLVVALSIVVDFSRSRALLRISKKYNSQALEADALHFSTDIWSSAVVLLGLFGVLVARQFDMPWLANADTIAALGVAVIVIGVSIRLGKKSVADLLDRIPEDLRDKVAQAASSVPGVEAVTKVRMRRSGPEVFADITLSVGYATTFEKAHEIADRAADAVRSVIPQADVVVHADPLAMDDVDVTTRLRVLAARHGLGAHGIRIYDEDGRRWLELHLEVQESLSLEEAHRQASQFEREVREEMPSLARVVSHLEPTGDSTVIIQAKPADQSLVRETLERYFFERRLSVALHNILVQQAGGELQVSFHCRLDAATAITDAHAFTVEVEEFLRSRIPGIGRVVIHVEPRKPAE